jgi:hypothetical protein
MERVPSLSLFISHNAERSNWKMNKNSLFVWAVLIMLLCFSQNVTAIEMETVLVFTDGVTSGITLNGGSTEIEFYPQSMVVNSKGIIMINRFLPALGIFSFENATKGIRVIPLQHAADKKFNARFFTDISLSDPTLLAMESSTATLREIDASGVISDVYIPSTYKGQIIDKFYPLNNEKFLFLDRGTKRILLRDKTAMKTTSPDKNGLDFANNSIDAMVSGDQIVTLEKNGQNLEVLLAPLEETEEVTLLASWKHTVVKALDVDEKGRFYFYQQNKKSSSIVQFDCSVSPAKRVEFNCLPLVFARHATRIARFEKSGSLLVLHEKDNSLLITRLYLSKDSK